MRISLYFSAAALALAAPASAAWQQATSKHFIIYGDMPTGRDEGFARSLRNSTRRRGLVRSMTDPAVGDGNRVQVFVVNRSMLTGRLAARTPESAATMIGSVTGPFIVTPGKARQILGRTSWSRKQSSFTNIRIICSYRTPTSRCRPGSPKASPNSSPIRFSMRTAPSALARPRRIARKPSSKAAGLRSRPARRQCLTLGYAGF